MFNQISSDMQIKVMCMLGTDIVLIVSRRTDIMG